jgi:hypothetical protein
MALDAPLQVLECRKHTAATAIHHVTTKTLCLVCNFAVQQLISETRRVYDAKLGNFLLQAQKRAIKLEVKIGVGPASNEIIALGATWVILDSNMGIHRQKILEKTNCGLVEMTTDHSRKFTRIYDPSLRIRSQTPQQHLFSPTSCCFSRFCCW